MKNNLKTFPMDILCLNMTEATKLLKWKEDFESELRQKMFEQDKVLAKVPKKLRSKEHSINIEEILG